MTMPDDVQKAPATELSALGSPRLRRLAQLNEIVAWAPDASYGHTLLDAARLLRILQFWSDPVNETFSTGASDWPSVGFRGRPAEILMPPWAAWRLIPERRQRRGLVTPPSGDHAGPLISVHRQGDQDRPDPRRAVVRRNLNRNLLGRL